MAWRDWRPPAPERALRERLYQLYHVLNHANLFGGGYVNQAERLLRQLPLDPHH